MAEVFASVQSAAVCMGGLAIHLLYAGSVL